MPAAWTWSITAGSKVLPSSLWIARQIARSSDRRCASHARKPTTAAATTTTASSATTRLRVLPAGCHLVVVCKSCPLPGSASFGWTHAVDGRHGRVGWRGQDGAGGRQGIGGGPLVAVRAVNRNGELGHGPGPLKYQVEDRGAQRLAIARSCACVVTSTLSGRS